MPTGTSFSQYSLAAFAEALAAKTSTPGGGSLAAYMIACGAATVAMAYRFTSGEKYAAEEARMARRVEELDQLRSRALELVQLDSDAYDKVTAAFGLPKGNDAEKAARVTAIQSALKGALEVPFETMATGLAVLQLAIQGASAINPNLASDCGSGANAALAGIESALANVRINAASIKDANYVRGKSEASDAMLRKARELADNVRGALQKHIGGK
jgi:formiminotetrahydrofolate cyclodeaminase